MTPETFFKKFEQFADAPNAVEKMRELVLSLAVQGKLVPHDERDESASLLLEAARVQRKKFVDAREIKLRKAKLMRVEEQPYTLPTSWAWARLSDIGYELGQKIPDKTFTYIDVGGIDSDTGQISDRVQALEPNEAPSRARKRVARGTVIYSTVRPYLRNIAIVNHDFEPEPIASTAFGILHPFVDIDSAYIFYWLRSSFFTAYVEDGMKGMAYPAINDEKFYQGPIPLPPLAEQKRIVAKVDALMALLDRLEAQQQERDTRHTVLARASLARFNDAPTPANLNFLLHKSYDITPADLRKTILSLAVRGKLVPQDPAEGTAEQLLEMVGETREADSVGSRSRLTKKTPSQLPHKLPYPLPSSWSWSRLGMMATNIEYGTSVKTTDNPTHVPVYRMGNIANGQLRDDGFKYMAPDADDLPGLYLDDGDILFNRTNSAELVGKSAVYRGPQLAATFASYLIRVQLPLQYLVPEFVNFWINSTSFRSTQLEPEITQQCGQANFNGTKLAATVVPVSPLAEQRRIVARVDELMKLLDRLEAELATVRTRATDLMEAVVAELTTRN